MPYPGIRRVGLSWLGLEEPADGQSLLMTRNDVVRVVRGVVVDDQNFPIQPARNLQRAHAFQGLVQVAGAIPGTKQDGYGHSCASLRAVTIEEQWPAPVSALSQCLTGIQTLAQDKSRKPS